MVIICDYCQNDCKKNNIVGCNEFKDISKTNFYKEFLNDLPEGLKQSSSRFGNIPLSNYGYFKKGAKNGYR